MSRTEKQAVRSRRWAAAILPLAMTSGMAAQDARTVTGNKPAAMSTQTGFYCNIKALTAEERARHKAATEKLLAKRKATIETDKGYEFHYSPADVSLTEVAEWVVLESKCCPFFDFHIDLEEQGQRVCLRLTGREGIKAFLRGEFGIEQDAER